MLRRSITAFATRQMGYVFWRQKLLLDIEKTKRTYLLNERPYPLAEITKRMAKIRAKYDDTTDTQEQTLLRGEYKYFSGKLVDLRHAEVRDMIAFLDIGAFFGFWDTAQVDPCIDELMLHIAELSGSELVHLLVALAGVRKHQSVAYRVCAEQLSLIPAEDFGFDDVIRLLQACEAEDPPALVHGLLTCVAKNTDRLSVADAAGILPTIAVTSASTLAKCRHLVEELRDICADEAADLTPIQIAAVCEALTTMDMKDTLAEERLAAAFVDKQRTACPRSIAMMMYAVGSLPLANALEERIFYLINRFCTSELFVITKTYVDCFAAMRSATSGGAQEAVQCRAVVQKVQELSQHLAAHLTSASVFVPPHILVGLLECLADSVAFKEAFGASFHTLLHAVCGRVVSVSKELDLPMLFDVLRSANRLGASMMQAASIAVIEALHKRLFAGLARDVGSNDAASWLTDVDAMSGVNAVVRQRLQSDIVPLLRHHVSVQRHAGSV